MTIGEHLAFSLKIRRWNQSAIQQRVEELTELLEIEHLLMRYPFGLSGGESQRVALGRALASRPQILLLDEPLSALDQDTRQHMYAVLKRIHESHAITALHVTHSQMEADELADLVLRLERGKVVPTSLPSQTELLGLAGVDSEP
jgi:ABC-type sugar transport system ATPase subunit